MKISSSRYKSDAEAGVGRLRDDVEEGRARVPKWRHQGGGGCEKDKRGRGLGWGEGGVRREGASE